MREYWLKAETGTLPEVKRSGIMFSQDDDANRIGVEVMDGGAPAELSGSILASIVRADGTTIQETGEKDGGRAWVDLPAAAFATLGGVEAYVVKSR